MVTQLVLLLWLDNTEQLQASSHEDEDKENKAVLKRVTIVIILEGGWEGEGREHSVRATTQVWVQLYCKEALNRKAYFTFSRKGSFTWKFL